MTNVVSIGDEDHPPICAVGIGGMQASIPMKSSRSFLAVSSLLLAGSVLFGVGAPAAQAQLGGAKPVNVPVKGLKFNPNKLKAAPKQKINFVWKENVAHNIVFDQKHKSPTQNKGTWTTSFDKAGTYKFKCTIHPGMEGQVTVK